MGVAMLPQAGVAMAMSYLAGQAYPQYADALTATVISAMVIFELIGPIATRHSLQQCQ